MTAFQKGERENDHFGRMRFIAGQLSDAEIAELAVYYAAPPSPEDDEAEGGKRRSSSAPDGRGGRADGSPDS